MNSRSRFNLIFVFFIGLFTLFNLASCAVLRQATYSNDTTRDCGRRPVCETFPLECREFESQLFHGFSPTEVPFVARVIVSERQPSGNDSTVCVAVLVSQHDLLLSSKCYRPTQKTVEDDTIEVDWGTTGESRILHPSMTSSENRSPFTIISDVSGEQNIVADIAQNSCLEPFSLFSFSGIICGFTILDSPELSCRMVELANANSNQFPQLNAQQLEGLANGAVVFRRVSEGDESESWRLIGFTNPDGKLSVLTNDDCVAFSKSTRGRVQCVTDVASDANITEPAEAIVNEVDLSDVVEQLPGNSTVAYIDEDTGSALIPSIIFALILILGAALCVLVAQNAQTNTTYETI